MNADQVFTAFICVHLWLKHMSETRAQLPTFLPGVLSIARGSIADYDALAPFHYLADRPATIADIWTVRYRASGSTETSAPGRDEDSRPVAVGVLSYPVPSSDAREKFLNRAHLSRNENLCFANEHVRTISRIIVHPQFRSLGLGSLLVRCLCEHCDTRYVEAISVMGRAHPLFEKGGMTRVEPDSGDKPVYYIRDRESREDEG
jgi:hypothetical protein